MRSRRGFTFIELLVSLLLLSIALSGLLGLWAFGFTTTGRAQDLGVGYSIARQEVEKAKNIGFALLPESSSEDTPVWTHYYDGLGRETTAGAAHFTATLAVWTTLDANGQKTSKCRRQMQVVVTAREGNQTVFDTTTYLTQGGV